MNIFLIDGRRVNVLDIRLEDINIKVIAHSLSNICRYTGHVTKFLSVAEHCVLLAKYFQDRSLNERARIALLHDAAESFISDIPAPVKNELVTSCGFKVESIEGIILEMIYAKFRCSLADSTRYAVAEADRRIRVNELCIRPKEAAEICRGLEPLEGVKIQCWQPTAARLAFLKKFRELFPEEELDGC